MFNNRNHFGTMPSSRLQGMNDRNFGNNTAPSFTVDTQPKWQAPRDTFSLPSTNSNDLLSRDQTMLFKATSTFADLALGSKDPVSQSFSSGYSEVSKKGTGAYGWTGDSYKVNTGDSLDCVRAKNEANSMLSQCFASKSGDNALSDGVGCMVTGMKLQSSVESVSKSCKP